MTNEIIEFYREHLKPIIQKMLLKTNYQGQGKVDYEEFGRDFDELLDLAIIGMQSNSDEDCISRAEAIDALGYNISITSDEGLDEYRTVLKEMLGKIYDTQKAQIEALPSIQPKSKTDVLDKIRAEIEQKKSDILSDTLSDMDCGIITGLEWAIEFIDKYKAESEEKE